MKSLKIKRHTIDFLFPISLFFIFTISALIVLLLSANIYKHVSVSSSDHFTTETCLTYVAEKIHKADTADGTTSMGIEPFYGRKAFVIKQKNNNTLCKTYIYSYKGALYEIFLEDGVETAPDFGTRILDINNFDVKELSAGIYSFTCTDTSNHSDSTIVSIHSAKEGD